MTIKIRRKVGYKRPVKCIFHGVNPPKIHIETLTGIFKNYDLKMQQVGLIFNVYDPHEQQAIKAAKLNLLDQLEKRLEDFNLARKINFQDARDAISRETTPKNLG